MRPRQRRSATLRERIVAYDRRALSDVTRIHANSRRVAARRVQRHRFDAAYHPPRTPNG
jgi:hypothetical protein